MRARVVGDSAGALAAAVRQRPDDARELLRRLLVDAGTARGAAAESTLVLARRIAVAYAEAWSDSFPLAQVSHFAEMSAERRAAKVEADSVRRAGNAALGHAGVRAALALWREALHRSASLADTDGMAAALGNIGVGFYRAAALDSAVHYLEYARELADAVHDRRTALNAVGVLGSVAKDQGDLRRAHAFYSSALERRASALPMRWARSAWPAPGLPEA